MKKYLSKTAAKNDVSHIKEFVGFSTVNNALCFSQASMTSTQKAYSAFADATLSLFTPCKFGSPSGQRELLRGLGEGTPFFFNFFLIGMHLARLDVPHGGARRCLM